ncbi:hypothetical protein RF11_11653 [Thelohanellus kitauei]|uniref:Uncharacterized protein n=1 Tax=Thelohanellus kitauei TaxID=669202 RepID=A0A0C2ICV8_THEKT|nr:hypothetical protein RF11_11653 [Thelohanellus kitauei]
MTNILVLVLLLVCVVKNDAFEKLHNMTLYTDIKTDDAGVIDENGKKEHPVSDGRSDQNIVSSASRVGRSDEPKVLFKVSLSSLIYSDELCHLFCVESRIVHATSGGGRDVLQDVKNIKEYFKSIGIIPYEIHFAILNCNDPILSPCIEEHKIYHIPTLRSYPRFTIGLILTICILLLFLSGYGVNQLHSYLLSKFQTYPSTTINFGKSVPLFL